VPPARFAFSAGVAVDSAGNVYVADGPNDKIHFTRGGPGRTETGMHMLACGRGCLVLALALVAGCGDNVNPEVRDAGVADAPVAKGHTVSTVGGAVRSSSVHYRMYGSMRSGETAAASAHYQRTSAVTGSVR
jgi:hypothetical protein